MHGWGIVGDWLDDLLDQRYENYAVCRLPVI
jgi:hypothetical protein